MGDIGWLFAGFAVVWLALGAFLVRMWVAQRDLNERLDRLEQRDPRDSG